MRSTPTNAKTQNQYEHSFKYLILFLCIFLNSQVFAKNILLITWKEPIAKISEDGSYYRLELNGQINHNGRFKFKKYVKFSKEIDNFNEIDVTAIKIMHKAKALKFIDKDKSIKKIIKVPIGETDIQFEFVGAKNPLQFGYIKT